MQVRRAEDFLQEMPYPLLQERHERTDTPGDEVRWSQDDVVSSFGSGQTPVREIKAELPTPTKTTTLGILRGAFAYVWQDSCRYIKQTTILTDEEQTDAFH